MVLSKNIRISEENKKRLISIGKKGESYNDIIGRLLDNFNNETRNREIVISKKTETRKPKQEEKITISEKDIFGEWDSKKAKELGW